MQSFPLPLPSLGYHRSGKEVEVRDSGSRHHQLCGCRNLQLIQSHEAPSQAHQEESFLPFSSWQSLSYYLSRVAKRSTPKPHGPLYSPSEPRGSLPFPSEPCGTLSSFTSEPHGPLSIYLLQSLVVHSFLQSRMVSSPFTLEPRGLLPIYFGGAWSPSFTLEPRGLLPLWLPGLGLNPSAHLPLQPHF